jgi:rare lipoprotein A
MNRFVLAAALCVASISVHAKEGWATWYGNESGSQTASGERFNENGATCAMPDYRRGQNRTVRVTVLSTGRSVTCRVNDLGPAEWTGNMIDVSKGLGRKLGMIDAGRVRVRVE